MIPPHQDLIHLVALNLQRIIQLQRSYENHLSIDDVVLIRAHVKATLLNNNSRIDKFYIE